MAAAQLEGTKGAATDKARSRCPPGTFGFAVNGTRCRYEGCPYSGPNAQARRLHEIRMHEGGDRR